MNEDAAFARFQRKGDPKALARAFDLTATELLRIASHLVSDLDPEVCHGQACVKGTRVMVSVILDNLAAGQTPEETVANYPSVDLQAIRAAMAFAADLARERRIGLPS